MSGKEKVRCVKCGASSKEDPFLTFHRFPLPSKQQQTLKARVWATYCFPNKDWTSEESLSSLYAQHKVLCGKHFDISSYTSSDRKRLNKFAIPTEAQEILIQLREQLGGGSSEFAQKPAAQMEVDNILTDIVASTSKSFLIKDSNEANGIVKDINIKKRLELSPREQKLYKRCRKNLSEIIRLRRKIQTVKKSKRSILTDLSSNEAVRKLLKTKMSSSFLLLLQSQLKNVPRKLNGRRWTLDDKVLALSIYKKSSSCYRLLRRLFCLPSVSSLKALLNKVPMLCGINDQIIDTIKEITEKRDVNENLCVLAFDEMSIRKNLTYNSKLDQLDGYQDHGVQGRTTEIATHALTFMAIGVRKHWKQPIAFYFSGSSVTADRLAVLLKEVLGACSCAGLQVISTVCDLDGVNIRALNTLGSSTDKPYFEHEGREIVTVLDPPHLLKCFRNNFMKHDIQYTQDIQIEGKRKQGVAKWSHIKDFFDKDQMNPNFVFAPALTEQHLQPNGKQKMKVKLAAQVLSHSVAAGIYAKVAQNDLPQEATATANIVSNIDKLFDAMNGDTPDRKRGKEYLTNMSSSSPHLKLFKEMKSFFSSMKFMGSRSKPPSQDGWLRTLNALERIFKNLNNTFNIKTLSVRRLNQDPLENCFGCIRSNCGCNPNPTAVQFVAALKTSIATNLINNNKNRNCLDDSNGLLDNFKVFLNKSQDTGPSHNQDASAFIEVAEEIDIPQCSGEMQACAYVCGFITKKIININCKKCTEIMLADPSTEVCHLFTSFKEYDDAKNRLKYVNCNLVAMVENAATIINNYMKANAHHRNIRKNIIKIVSECLHEEWLRGCEEHQEINFINIIRCTVVILLKRFCKIKNQQFVEEASKNAMKRKINILRHVYLIVLFFVLLLSSGEFPLYSICGYHNNCGNIT